MLAKKENLLYFEVSAKQNDSVKSMFYSAIANLPFFDQFGDLPKNELIKEIGILINYNNP